MSVVYALTSAVAASLMYGGAALIALERPSVQIEQKLWLQGPRVGWLRSPCTPA